MKKVFKGWIAKSYISDDFGWTRGEFFNVLDMPEIFETKDTKEDWDDFDWPPKKITITVEVQE